MSKSIHWAGRYKRCLFHLLTSSASILSTAPFLVIYRGCKLWWYGEQALPGRSGGGEKKERELAVTSHEFEFRLQCRRQSCQFWAIGAERKRASNVNRHRNSAWKIIFPRANDALKVRLLQKDEPENCRGLVFIGRWLIVPGQQKNF